MFNILEEGLQGSKIHYQLGEGKPDEGHLRQSQKKEWNLWFSKTKYSGYIQQDRTHETFVRGKMGLRLSRRWLRRIYLTSISAKIRSP